MIDTIYIVRHGFRLQWYVDGKGNFQAIPTPTGIPTDPCLAAHGEDQSEQLAAKLVGLDIDRFYSSPYYRCLQTIQPTIKKLQAGVGQPGPNSSVRVEPGIGEYFEPFEYPYPHPAPVDALHKHFPGQLDGAYKHTGITRPDHGENPEQLHTRAAEVLDRIIAELDDEIDPATGKSPSSVLICSHAAMIIAMSRALTGNMPDQVYKPDFDPYTASLFKFVRRPRDLDAKPRVEGEPLNWKGGKGVRGGWDCELNGDCSFLKNGKERGWWFWEASSVTAEYPDFKHTPEMLERTNSRM